MVDGEFRTEGPPFQPRFATRPDAALPWMAKSDQPVRPAIPTPYTMKFIIMVWLEFLDAGQTGFDRARNPACMNMTRKPVTKRPNEIRRESDF